LEQLNDGQDLLSLTPVIADAARIRIFTPITEPSNSVSYVFVGEATTPIEIDGSTVEGGSIGEDAFREIFEILDMVASGNVYDEIDSQGRVIDSWLPDPPSTVDAHQDGHSRAYRGWRNRCKPN
jgi:hypothetical protein